MDWKSIVLCLLVASVSFAQEEGGLEPFDQTKSISHLVLDRAQELIDRHLNKLNAKTKVPLSSLTIEQEFSLIKDLWSVLLDNSTATPVIAYCKNIFSQAQMDASAASDLQAQQAILREAAEQIGQAVFLAERYPQESVALIDHSSMTVTRQNIFKRCQAEMQKLAATCRDHAAMQQKAGLQDADLSRSMLEPQIIAKVLLTTSGKLNLGMISLVRETFIPQNSLPEYQVGMDRVLSSMNGSWQEVIDTIVKPLDRNIVSEEIIRADLALSRTDIVNDFHARLTALKALLSQLNQGAAGDCFAVALAIKKQNEFFLQSLRDYGELLRGGYLTRVVDGRSDQFYFKNILADDDLQTETTLKSTGALGKGGIMLWDTPGIISACRQVGIDDVKGSAFPAIQNLFSVNSSSIQTSPEEIINAFAALSVKRNPKLDLKQQQLRGKYGFSVTQNHLLRAWETTLASMAEATKGDHVRDQIIQSVHEALEDKWQSVQSELPQELQLLVGQVQDNFEKTLNLLNRFVYNAAIPLKHVSRDGSSTDGGFELYKRIQDQPLIMGQRVTTIEDFRTYLIEIINLTATNLTLIFSSANEQAALSHIADTLVAYMKGNTFLRDVLYAYDEENKKVADPVTHYQDLERTPMTTLDGDHPYAVEAIDIGCTFIPDRKTIDPQNPYQLIHWIMDLAAWKEQTEHYLEEASLEELEPATAPQHVFNIAFEAAEIKDFVISQQTSDQWIRDLILVPNVAIANARMDTHTKQNFSNNLVQWIKENMQISNHAVNGLNRFINNINSKPLTFQTYASTCLKMLMDFFQADDQTAKELTTAFDTLFLQCLPEAMMQQISQGAIRFAKTKGDEGDKNLYFCVFYNPRTAHLSFGTITEDKTELCLMK